MIEHIHGRADTRLRLSVAVAGAAIAVAGLTTGAADPAQLDASFVAAVRADGRDVPQAATLVAAARKICTRRQRQVDPVERHRSALTLRELAAVGETFAGDARRFSALALDTYCPS